MQNICNFQRILLFYDCIFLTLKHIDSLIFQVGLGFGFVFSGLSLGLECTGFVNITATLQIH